MNFKELLETIIQSNQDIRFTAIFDRYGTIKEKIQKDETSPMLDEYETKTMLREAASLWFHRRNLVNKLGKGHYSMTVYDNLIRVTMPLIADYFIIISHDHLDDQPSLVKKILQILESNKID